MKNGAWWHEVSEDGLLNSNFTVSLTAEPLSRVHLDFGSELDGLRFDPPSLVFDHSNYTVDTLVRVLGFDDAIDQGNSHDDVVVISTRSHDDFIECQEAVPARVCGQAATYANFSWQGLGTMSATIYDNDVAGVTVTVKDSLNATFNNYGDALLPGMYYLSLNTQPTSVVTVAVSGFSSFADGGSGLGQNHLVRFDAYNWSTPAAVSVAASAPTAARPACASGNRYCDAVNFNRTEELFHATSSLDGFYQSAFSVDSVSMPVSVKYDKSDPPKVESARFGDLLNSISVIFDQKSNRGGLSGTFACDSILNLTTAEVTTMFGSGAFCAFTSDSLLKITFGKEPTVLENDVIGIRNTTLQAHATSASLFTHKESFTVAAPESPKSPAVFLSTSSLFVGRCDPLTLSGHGATVAGGRDLEYTYSVTGLNGISVANISAVLNSNNALNGGSGTPSLTLASSDMPLDSSFMVKLTVRKDASLIILHSSLLFWHLNVYIYSTSNQNTPENDSLS
jgi:hypothetical protein